MTIRDNFGHDDSDKFADFLRRSDVQPEWKKMELARMDRRLKLADRYESECQDVAAALMDGSSYALALKAAAHGDRDAARCFVGGAFPVPPTMQKDPVAMSNYRDNARRLISEGIAAGDWGMVDLAQLVYSPNRPRLFDNPVFNAPLYIPSVTLAATIAPPGGDAALAYRMVRLQQFARPEQAAEWDSTAKAIAVSLGARQRDAAEDWARTMAYLRYRNLPRPDSDDFNPCAF